MSIRFPEDYTASQQRCKQIAHQLAQQHKHENILLVLNFMPLWAFNLQDKFRQITKADTDVSNAGSTWTFGGVFGESP